MILNLDPQFKPLTGIEIPYESFVFSGGEPHIRIHSEHHCQTVYVTHRINSFNDLGLLSIAVDALKRMGTQEIHALIPYFPASRQDRIMVQGESLTVKVYARIVNNLGINSVTIFDPHSDVTPALLENCRVINNHSFIEKVIPLIPKGTILVAPDAGASKKIYSLATHLHINDVLICGKKRNIATGDITGFTVPDVDLNKRPCLVVDDICDGGGTFLGLAAELKYKNAGNLFLAVSHGIFSKGHETLSSVFKTVFTTDSIKTLDSPDIRQIPLQNIINLEL